MTAGFFNVEATLVGLIDNIVAVVRKSGDLKQEQQYFSREALENVMKMIS